MAEPQTPNFAEPGSYIRYYGESVTDTKDTARKLRFIQLQQRAAPQRYPYKFASIGVDAKGNSFTFSDLDVAMGHIEEVFLGVAPGLRVQVSLPFDTRLLKWDTTLQNISDDQQAVITHGLSPYEIPSAEFWIRPNKNYPALIPQNATADLLRYPGGKNISPQIIWIGATFRIEVIPEDTDIHDMLSKKKVPSRPITFGGSFRVTPQ